MILLDLATGRILVPIHAALLMLAIMIELARFLPALLIVAIKLPGLLAALLLLITIDVARLVRAFIAFVVHCVPHDICEPKAHAMSKRHDTTEVPRLAYVNFRIENDQACAI